MADISAKLGKIRLRNPLILASGILGTEASMLKRVSEMAGAVTMKSIGPERREGWHNPAVLEYGYGLINAVGLPSPGYKEAEDEFKELKDIKTPLIASIYGNNVADFAEIAEHISKYKPDIIELNMSCPNKADGMLFSQNEDIASYVVREVKKFTKIPLSAKLTPNCKDIVAIAKAVKRAGADFITAINTVGPGMIIDINAKKPVLAYKKGGLSGPAIKPIAVRCVYDIYENVRIPIIGTGGVMAGKDAIEMLMAGASAVGIGSAVYYRGINVFNKINDEIKAWMIKNNVDSLKQIIGKAH